MAFRFIESRLSDATTYKKVMQWLARENGNVYIANLIAASPGAAILDIGCGPSAILDYLDNIQYTGLDLSEQYINDARKKYGHRATFYCTSVDEFPNLDDTKFDYILLLGVQHHLSNDQLELLMRNIPTLLSPRGRVVTSDPVLAPVQNPVARLLMKLDRGRYIRNQEGYQGFMPPSLSVRSSHIKTDMLRLPYSILFQVLELTS